MWIRRNVSAIQVEAGEVAHVEVEIGNAGKRTGTLLMEEELSPVLGPSPRFVVEPLGAGADTVRHYQIHAENRGRYPVGPMHVRVGDPLGMVDLDKVLPSSATILVTPRTEPPPAHPADRALGRRRRQPHPRPARRRQPRRHHPRVPPR